MKRRLACGKRPIRRAYCDQFSRSYDRFVALHSRDAEGRPRKFLADRLPVQNGGSAFDVCTGTAILLSHLPAIRTIAHVLIAVLPLRLPRLRFRSREAR